MIAFISIPDLYSDYLYYLFPIVTSTSPLQPSNRICSELFKLRILDDNIQDTKNNMTRFIVIAKKPLLGRPSGRDKTLMTFGVTHTPGILKQSNQPSPSSSSSSSYYYE